MDYGLARRLLDRVAQDVDINPQGLNLDQLKELELSPADWQLVYDIEAATKKRLDVLKFVIGKLGVTIETVAADVKEELAAPPPVKSKRGK